ncbi:serine-rich adhesin for platelets-like [Heterodontus francisci]|uniref:serine-rich adhesin for platelets-like n=1 Tax=Heterodontus francisci TaxID=7792 RepID=UPI00355AEFAD
MEASLTCAVCLSVFENPTTLPVCSHNFCKKCILECVTKSFSYGLGYSSSSSNNNIWRNSQLECPLCRKSNFIAEGAVNLPGNTTLAEVVKLFRSQQQAAGAGLEEEEEEVEAGGARGPGPGGARAPSGRPGERALCQRHPHRKLQLFCKVCKQLACGQCVSEDHRGVFHAVNLVDMIYQEEKLEYFNNLRELRQLNNSLKIEIADTPSDNEHILDYEKEIVNTKFDEISEKVELKRRQLLDEIEKQQEWKKTERKARLEGKRTQKERVEEYLKECEGLVNECNPVNFLKVACDLNERVKSNLAIILPTLEKHDELTCLQPHQFLIKPVMDSISALQLTKDTTKPNSILDTGNTASKLCTDSYRFKTTLKMWKQPKDFKEAKFSPETVTEYGYHDDLWCITAKDEYRGMSLEELRYKHYQSYRKDWNCFVTEEYSDNENGVDPSVSSGISTELLKTPDGVQQPHVKLFSFGQSSKNVKKKFCGNSSSNLELSLPLDSGSTTSISSVSNSEMLLSNSFKKLLNVGDKKQKHDPVSSSSVQSKTISSITSVVRSLGTTTATVSLPVTLNLCTTMTGFDKTGEHQQKLFYSTAGGVTVYKCSGSPLTQKNSSNSNFVIVNPTITSGVSLSSVSSSVFTFGNTSASKTGNQQPLPASASFMFEKLNSCSAASNSTSGLTSVFHNKTLCDSPGKDVNPQNRQATCMTSATYNSKVLSDSIGTALKFSFGNVTEQSSQEGSPKTFKFGTSGPLCGQAKTAPLFSVFNPGTEKFSLNLIPNTKAATRSSESLRNQESLTSITGSVVARAVSDLFTFAQVPRNDVPNLNEKQYLSTISRSTTASSEFKLEDPSIVTSASSLFASPSSVSSSSNSTPFAQSFLTTQSSIKSLNFFTRAAETSPVFSRTNSTGSSSVVFTAGFSQDHPLTVSQQQSTVTPVDVNKVKKSSTSELLITAEPYKHNRAHSSSLNHEDLSPAVIQQQSTDKTTTNIGVETCKLKETSLIEILTSEPAVFHSTESASSDCEDFAAGFSKDLSSVSQQQTHVAPIDAVATCKTKEASAFEVPISTQPSVIERESVPLLQPSNVTPALENPLERFDNINKEGKKTLIFNDQSSDVQELHFSEKLGHSKVHQSSAATSDRCHVEQEDSTSDKEDPSLSTKRWLNIEALNLSLPGGDSASNVPSNSSSFAEANNGITKEDIQRTATDHSLFTALSTVFCPVFTFGAGSDFQFKLGASDLANAAGQKGNNRGDCKPVHEPMFPFPPPVNYPPAALDGENVLFSNRAKLYCFERTSLQWKERAFGEIRVLEHKITKLPRLVMWNAANKCCANHWITRDLELKHAKASYRIWTWRALDYSENKQAFLEFAVHFKLKEMAQVFKQIIERVQNTTDMSGLAEKGSCCSTENEKNDQNGNDNPTLLVGASDLEQEVKSQRGMEEQEEGDEDVVMLSEITPTPEQRALALNLLLPPTFFCYKNKPGYHSSDDEEENFETAVKKLYPGYNKNV